MKVSLEELKEQLINKAAKAYCKCTEFKTCDKCNYEDAMMSEWQEIYDYENR